MPLDADALRLLAAQNKLAALRAAVKGNTKLDAISGFGDSALFAAAQAGHGNAVKVLLEAGASPDVGEPRRRSTPLSVAAYHRHTAIALALLEAGASPKAGRPLHKAVQHGDVRLVTALLAAGAPVGVATSQGYTERDYLKQVKGPAAKQIAALLDGVAKAAPRPKAAKKKKARSP